MLRIIIMDKYIFVIKLYVKKILNGKNICNKLYGNKFYNNNICDKIMYVQYYG